MAIDPHYIPAFSIETVILDKDSGAPLSGGLVYFEQDNQRGVLKPIYQITGTSPNYLYIQLPNPMVLSSIGTFEDAMENPVVPYFFPYDGDIQPEYYYVRVTSSEDVPQFTREAVPYLTISQDDEVESVVSNEISNPQFANILFPSGSANTYSFNAAASQVVKIAPGWDIVVSSAAAGTVIVNQLTPVGSLNTVNNPGTVLEISSTGLSSLLLRQRIFGSPNLWGNGYITAGFTAKTNSGSPITLNMYYSQSDGTVVNQLLVSGNLLAAEDYEAFSGSTLLPISSSSQSFPNAYIDIYFVIPLNVQLDITSVMLASTGQVSIDNVAYDQTSYASQVDDLFHYYKPQLEYKPIPSILTAWDFPLNPAQSLGTVVTMNTTASYIWDQTIGQSVVGNVAITRNTVTGGIQAITANAAEAFYYTQYLTGSQAKKILGTYLSVNVNAFRTEAGGAVTCRVYLYRGSSSAVFPVLPLTIGGATPLAASGIFTPNTTAAQGLNWTEIPRSNLQTANGTLSTVTTSNYSSLDSVTDLSFTGWQITDSTQISDTDKFAIVVTFQCPTTASVVVVNSISVNQGMIATRPAPQRRDEVIRECQYYYESSFLPETVPGVASNGILVYQYATANGANGFVFPTPFNIPFNVPKRTAPILTLYSPNGGAANTVQAIVYVNAIAVNAVTNPGTGSWTFGTYAHNAYAVPQTGTALASGVTLSTVAPVGAVLYNFTANARLGVV